MKLHTSIDKEGNIILTENQRQWLLKQGNRDILVSIDDTPSTELRRYFEGAIIPFIFYQLPHSGWKDFKECREAVKSWFRPLRVRGLGGAMVVSAENTGGKSKKWFQRFVEDITAWMMEQGMELPDPDNFKAWRDSAPIDEYPPIVRLRKAYLEAKAT